MRKNKLVPKNMHDERSVAQNDGTLVASMRASILPPPDEIERYEAICHGTLKTLLSTYEKQTDHRIEMESAVVNNDIRNSRYGQVFAFIIAMTAIVGGIVMICLDKNTQGLVSIIAALVALLGVFLGSRIVGAKKLSKKSEKNPE